MTGSSEALEERFQPGPRTASAVDFPCELVKVHTPLVVITEYHHTKPEYLQKRLYGKTIYGPEMWVCSNCHEAIHAWLYWIMGERKQPRNVGRNAKAAAEKTFDWYITERNHLANL